MRESGRERSGVLLGENRFLHPGTQRTAALACHPQWVGNIMRWLPARVFGSDTQAHWVCSAGVCAGGYCKVTCSESQGMQPPGKLYNVLLIFSLNYTVSLFCVIYLIEVVCPDGGKKVKLNDCPKLKGFVLWRICHVHFMGMPFPYFLCRRNFASCSSPEEWSEKHTMSKILDRQNRPNNH